ATVPPAPHPRSAGSTATDDLLEPAPRSSRSRTAHRSSHPNRASDVPHISSRSADYTPTPGPIERLFPHPASVADAGGDCGGKRHPLLFSGILGLFAARLYAAYWSILVYNQSGAAFD